MLEKALALHNQGQLAEAEQLYRDILRQQPENAQVGYYLGRLAIDAGMPEHAVPILERVCMLDPGHAQARNELGRSLHMLGRREEALDNYDRAILLRPDVAALYNSRALILTELYRTEEALESFEHALQLQPDYPFSHSNSGFALAQLERYEEALACFDGAVALAPDNAQFHYNRADALKNLRRHAEALAAYDRAIALDPDLAEAHINRGLLLARLNRFDEALTALDRAIVLAPDKREAHTDRGFILKQLARSDEAMAAFDRAIALEPDNSDGYCGRLLLLAQTGRLEEALAYGREITRNPALRADAEFNLAILQLQQGRWEDGWHLYEARKARSQPTENRIYPQPDWRGTEPLEGKALYVYAEQGLGDTIQFCRYLALVKAQGAAVFFSPQHALERLMRGLDSEVTVMPWKNPPPSFDYHMPLLSMPLAFRTGTENIPDKIPYLHAEEPLVETWRARIGTGGFKIGLCWTGSLNMGLGLERSFSPADCAPLAKLPGVRLIALHKRDRFSDLAGLPDGMTVETLGADFDAGPDAFVDSAAVMQSLDLIVSCDTATAHLAGALGRPLWVALNDSPEWRWLLNRDDSPWYPTATLFRQPATGDWTSVFAAMTERLATMLAKA